MSNDQQELDPFDQLKLLIRMYDKEGLSGNLFLNHFIEDVAFRTDSIPKVMQELARRSPAAFNVIFEWAMELPENPTFLKNSEQLRPVAIGIKSWVLEYQANKSME